MSANPTTAEDNRLESGEKVDRDIPALTNKKKKSNMTRLAMAGALLVALLIIATGCAMFMKRLDAKKQEQRAAQAKLRPNQSAPASKSFDAAKKRIKFEEAAVLPVPASAALAYAGANPASVAGGAQTTNAGAQQAAVGSAGKAPSDGSRATGAALQTPEQRRSSGDVLVDIDDAGTAPASAAAAGAIPAVRDAGATSRNGIDDKLKPSQLLGGVAAQRPDLSMLLRRGTTIPCGQYTYIKTTNPGAATCVISKDIYSANGDVLLVERGSMVFGEEREGLVQGQDAMPVLWSRIDTPRGVTVDINSLGTDALGASGVPVSVDDHLLKRFGGAVMLSLIGDFGQALSNRADNSQGTVRLSTTSTAGQDLATKTLDSTINIPPTGYSPNGAIINILLLRDMDFRSVYELAHF